MDYIFRRLPEKLLTYLRLTGQPLGLLINFGQELVKDGVSRVVNKRVQVPPLNYIFQPFFLTAFP